MRRYCPDCHYTERTLSSDDPGENLCPRCGTAMTIMQPKRIVKTVRTGEVVVDLFNKTGRVVEGNTDDWSSFVEVQFDGEAEPRIVSANDVERLNLVRDPS